MTSDDHPSSRPTSGLTSRPTGQVYRDVVARLRNTDITTAELDARLLLSAATGVDDVSLIADPDRFLDPKKLALLEALVAQRIAGKPVSRLLGVREFWGLDFSLNAETLDPRPDSETLIEAVLGKIPDKSAALKMLDLGTGTGCLLLALLSEFPNAVGTGVDCSEIAVEAATKNADRLGLGTRSTFQVGDWARGLDGAFDVIVSNPPYIPTGDLIGLSVEVREHDPAKALDGGTDGLDAYRRILPEMRRLLTSVGYGFLEFGEGQSADIASIAENAGLEALEIRADLSSVLRVLTVKR